MYRKSLSYRKKILSSPIFSSYLRINAQKLCSILCSLTIPVLGWYHSGHALEHFCKIIGIIIPYLHTHVLNAYAPVLQQFLASFTLKPVR